MPPELMVDSTENYKLDLESKRVKENYFVGLLSLFKSVSPKTKMYIVMLKEELFFNYYFVVEPLRKKR